MAPMPSPWLQRVPSPAFTGQKIRPSPRTLQWACDQGLTLASRGWRFLMSEVPLCGPGFRILCFLQFGSRERAGRDGLETVNRSEDLGQLGQDEPASG